MASMALKVNRWSTLIPIDPLIFSRVQHVCHRQVCKLRDQVEARVAKAEGQIRQVGAVKLHLHRPEAGAYGAFIVNTWSIQLQ